MLNKQTKTTGILFLRILEKKTHAQDATQRKGWMGEGRIPPMAPRLAQTRAAQPADALYK